MRSPGKCTYVNLNRLVGFMLFFSLLMLNSEARAAATISRLAFLNEPSGAVASGGLLDQSPIVWPVNSQGWPTFQSLRDLEISAYQDSRCTNAAPGKVKGSVYPLLPLLGLGVFHDVSYAGAGDIYLKISANGVAAGCSSLIRVKSAGADHLIAFAGDHQTAAVGTLLPVLPQVKALDSQGNGVAGVTVSFLVTSNSGNLGSASAVTDAQGLAATSFTLGAAPGVNTWIAFRAPLPTAPSPWIVTFTATATAVATPTSLALSGPGTQPVGACSPALTVSTRDHDGQLINSPQSLAVNLNGRGSAALFSDASCQAALSNLVIAAGTSSQSFYLRDTRAEALSLTASAQGLMDSPVLVDHILVGPPATLAFSSQPSDKGVAGQDLAVQPAIRILDAYGNLTQSAASIQLAAASDPICTVDVPNGLRVTTNPMGATAGSAVFAGVNETQIGQIYLKATSEGLKTACSSVITVVPAAPSVLTVIAGDSQSAAVGSALSVSPSVKATDAFGNLINGVNVSFAIVSGGGSVSVPNVLTDANGIASTGVTLGNAPGQMTLRAVGSGTPWGSTPASVLLNETALAGAPFAMQFTGPSNQVAGACSVPFTIALRDSFGNSTTTPVALAVNLSGSASGSFFSDPSCTQAIQAAQLTPGSGVVSIYFKDTTAETLTLTANAGLGTKTSSLQVNPGEAAQLAYAAQPSGVAQAGGAFATQPIVAAQDGFGNTVAAASGNVTLSAYLDAACSSPASGNLTAFGNPVLLSAGLATFAGVSFSRAGALFLQASAPGLKSVCGNGLGITAAAADHLIAIAGDGQTATVGQALAVSPQVKVIDAYGNAVTGFALSFTPASGGGSVGTSPIPSDTTGLASASFVLGNAPGLNTLLVQGATQALPGSPASVTFSETAVAGLATALVMNGPVSQIAGNCSSAFAILLKDSKGNPAQASTPLSLSLAGSGAGTLYSDSACTQAASVISLAAGLSSTSFYVQDSRSENLLLSVSSSGLSGATLPYTIQAGAASILAFSSQPSATAVAGQLLASQPKTVIRDSYGNLATGAVNSVSLAAYLDSSCSVAAPGVLGGAASPVTSAAGVASFSGVHYDLSGSLYLGASSVALGSICSIQIAVSAGAADHLIAVQGDGQSAMAGNAVANNPIVRVLDAFGNSVPGAAVSFTVMGGGSVSSATAMTDGSGLATTQFTLGLLPGINTLTAALNTGHVPASGSASVEFQATGTPRAPQHLLLSGPASSTAGICATAFTVKVLDDNNSEMIVGSDLIVSLSGFGSGAYYLDSSCSARVTSVTLAQNTGSTQLYFSDHVAENLTLIAQAAGLSSSSTLLNVNAGPATHLVFSAQPSPTGKFAEVFGAQPVITALDAYGNLNTSYAASISLAAFSDVTCTLAASGTLNATSNPLSASAGTAVFAGVGFSQPGTIYLQAKSENLASACSNAISLSGGMVMALGSSHSCALLNGGVKCWGFNALGNLGNAGSASSATPVQVQGLTSGVTDLAAGGNHSCALLNGGVSCWGSNGSGELGNSGVASSNIPMSVADLDSGVKALAAGDSHTCALLNTGLVKCWGSNASGQLGNGVFTDSALPVQVQGLPLGVSAIAAASSGNCALMNDSKAYCWGFNDNGQLGDGTTSDSAIPVLVQGGLTGIRAIMPGFQHSCVQLDSGIQCWGRNEYGQLGNGTFDNSLVPVSTLGLSGLDKLLSVGTNFNCAITSSGTAKCWGHNGRGELGDARASGAQSNIPVQVQGLTSGTQLIKAGSIHACASTDGVSLQCWGWGRSGQLGNGGFIESYVPSDVVGL